MGNEAFADATLIVFGHGSTVDPQSGASVFAQVAELQRRGGFAKVLPAFWKQEPRLGDVLAAAKSPRIFLVPMFVSEGYFSETVIPQAIAYYSWWPTG